MPVAIRKPLSETLVEVHLMSQKDDANNIMTQNDGNWQDETHLIFHYCTATERIRRLHQCKSRSPCTSSHCDLYIIIQPFRLLVYLISSEAVNKIRDSVKVFTYD